MLRPALVEAAVEEGAMAEAVTVPELPGSLSESVAAEVDRLLVPTLTIEAAVGHTRPAGTGKLSAKRFACPSAAARRHSRVPPAPVQALRRSRMYRSALLASAPAGAVGTGTLLGAGTATGASRAQIGRVAHCRYSLLFWYPTT
jgi:hypothetical protein